jgi:hypothetical protein
MRKESPIRRQETFSSNYKVISDEIVRPYQLGNNVI